MSSGPLPPETQNGPSPVYCPRCGHSGRIIACDGCGGPTGGNGWGVCAKCVAKIAEEEQQNNPPSPPMMPPEEVITSWGFSTQTGSPPTYSVGLESIEATEPRTLPDERQQRRERHRELARAIATWEGGVTPLPPLEAFAAEAATNAPSDVEPDEVLAYEIQCLQHNVLSLEEKIGELSKSIATLTQAVLGRNA